MRKITLLIFLLFVGIYAKAQTLDVVYKPYGEKYSICVIKPTIQNFISLLSLDENQFELVMKEYKYFEENSSGKYRAFWNGTLDNYVYAECVNTYNFNVMRNEIRFFVASDMVYPSDAITSLFRALKPYYKMSKPNEESIPVDYFAFKENGFMYEFFILSTLKLYDITVLKKEL